MITVIDNYDSFTYNLVQYLRELAKDEEVRVVRNDVQDPDQVLAAKPRAIVLSPGPSVPEAAGMCIELVKKANVVPIFGVCLGLQILTVAYGGRVLRAPLPRHGKTSEVRHNGQGIFDSVPDPVTATRYHSLIAQRDSLPHDLTVTAWTEDNLVMGLAHRRNPHYGVQFHPESYLTSHGKQMLENFLKIAHADYQAPPEGGGVG